MVDGLSCVMGRFSSLVLLQLHKLDTEFYFCRPHKSMELVHRKRIKTVATPYLFSQYECILNVTFQYIRLYNVTLLVQNWMHFLLPVCALCSLCLLYAVLFQFIQLFDAVHHAATNAFDPTANYIPYSAVKVYFFYSVSKHFLDKYFP